MPEEIIRETISITRTSISEDDKEISQQYNDLVRAALKEARRTLRFGTPTQKMRIITAAMSSASRLAALDSASEVEEHRLAFESIVNEITDIPEQTLIITSPIIEIAAEDVEPTPLAE